MKTLYEILCYRFLQGYLKALFIVCIGVFFLSYALQENMEHHLNLILLPIMISFSVYITALPTFKFNLGYLINQHFNRLDLIKFHFELGLLMTALSLASWLTMYLVYLVAIDVPLSNIIKADYQLHAATYIDVLAFLYAASYFAATSLLYIQTVSRQISDSEKKKQFKFNLMVSLLIVILHFLNFITTLHLGFIFLFLGAFLYLLYFYRRFIMEVTQRTRVLAFVFALIVTLPFTSTMYAMRLEAQNARSPVTIRVANIKNLGFLAPKLEKEEIVGLIKKIKDKDYKSFNSALRLFSNRIELETLLKHIKTKERAKIFIVRFRKKTMKKNQTKKIIAHMSDLSSRFNLGVELVSESLLSDMIVGNDYINDLINSKSPYKQLSAVFLARSNMEPNDLQVFYESNIEKLDQSVLEVESIKREIASLSDQEEK